MSSLSVRLIDKNGNLVATARVDDEGTYFGGTVDLSPMPAALRRKFEEFEDLVNGQVFNLADEVQDQIAAEGLTAVFETGAEAVPEDLQIFPTIGTVSFKARVRRPSESGVNGPTRGGLP